ncbi:MAG: glycosyltransferase [Planctomycetota bacterium]|nr:MAG: glycosyltransferase [Planctomycetota bacterium]
MATGSLNVAHLVAALDVGGVERQLAERFRARRELPVNNHVVCLLAGGFLADEFEKSRVPIHVLGKVKKSDIPGSILRLVHFFRKKRIHVVHNYLADSNLWGALAARIAGVRVVFNSQRQTLGIEPYYLVKAYPVIAALADRVLAVSNAIADQVNRRCGIRRNRILVVYNGLDHERFNHTDPPAELGKKIGLRENVPVVGAVGRIEPRKGQEILVQAASKMRNGDACFLFVGGGVDRERLEAKAKAAGLEDRVIFAGNQSDVLPYLALMDIFAMPSIGEGMPNAFLEAQAAGLPVIGYDDGGTKEAMIPDKTGILLKDRSPKAVAAAIDGLIDDALLRKRMGRHAREFAATFDIKAAAAIYERLYYSAYYRREFPRPGLCCGGTLFLDGGNVLRLPDAKQ